MTAQDITDELDEAWAKASAIAAGITGARDVPDEEVLDGLAQLTWELADAIKAMKDKVHPRNIEQEIAWIRENAERRLPIFWKIKRRNQTTTSPAQSSRSCQRIK